MISEPAPVLTFLDALVETIERAGAYNRNDQTPPAAVLWTDKEGEWRPLLPSLRERLPFLLTLGTYTPAERTGPAYWLRCVLAGTLPIPGISPPGSGEETGEGCPVIYLPGVSRQELRAVEDCPQALQPLAELQYRGVLWTQRNGRDWTAAAFLQSDDGGLGIALAADTVTRDALRRALPQLADEPLEGLRAAVPLKAAFFDALLHPDEVRTLLRWLHDPAGFQRRCDPSAWAAFCDLCQAKYGFDPVADGPITAARLLGERQGAWEQPWQRLAEAPGTYLGVAIQLRQARPRQVSLFGRSESWPQDNEAAEAELRASLTALLDCPPSQARQTVATLEKEHGPRRGWLWATLGEAPLAGALEHLARLARETEQPLGGASVSEIASAYAERGWRADAALLAALASVEAPGDLAAVRATIRALYTPWLEAAAIRMQETAVDDAGYTRSAAIESPAGTCLLFSDGLRFDVAQLLREELTRRELSCALTWRLAALPTVTATAKPAVSPVANRLGPGRGLDAATRPTGTRVTAPVLDKLLGEAGFQVMDEEAVGDPTGRAWTELGDIDAYCHEHGWKVAKEVAAEVRALATRVASLLNAGWQRVVVVTDHGWLLLPGGLPKVDLPEHLTDVRKGRCARLKPFASSDQPTVPWFWDGDVRIAVARGIACFEAGREAEHGGVSPQECVVPVLTVSRRAAATAVHIEQATWRGLRLSFRVSPAAGLMADLRTRAGDPGTSLAAAARPIGSDGSVSLLVPDEDRAGEAALIVILGPDGAVLAQTPTMVGG